MRQHQTDFGEDEMPPLGFVPDPKKRRGNPERTVQVAVLRYLRTVLPAGSIVAAIKNEEQPRGADEFARARFVQARIASGLVPGIPDLLCLLPCGQTLFFEVKAPKVGRLSADQRSMHAKLATLGHRVGVARSIEDARELLRQWGVVTREHVG